MLNLPRQQADFERTAMRLGTVLTLNYAGNYTLNPTTLIVARAPVTPSTAGCYGFTTLKSPASSYLSERLDKWGRAFLTDGAVTFPMRFSTANLVSIQDMRFPSSPALELIALPPDTISEGIFHLAYVRSQPVYNHLLSVVKQDDLGDGVFLKMVGVPCRLLFPGIAPMMAGGTDTMNRTEAAYDTPVLEMPNVYDSNGKLITLVPGEDTILDAATTVQTPGVSFVYRGPLPQYRVVSPNLDPGGEGHHQRYQLTLIND